MRPEFFLHGVYKRASSRLSGTIVFEMHTWSEDRTDGLPAQFTVRFTGVGGTNYGQLEFNSPDLPAIKGQGRFTWLGEYQKPADTAARQAV